MLTTVTRRIPTVEVKEIIENSENLIFLNTYDGKNDKPKVFLNGILMGLAIDAQDFLDEMKAYRSNGLLNKDVSFTFNTLDNEILIFCDEGRLIRPVLTVNEKNEVNLKEFDYINIDETLKNVFSHICKQKDQKTGDFVKSGESSEEIIEKYKEGSLDICKTFN